MQPSRNLILASLPKAVYQKLLPSLTSVQLRDGDILYEAGRTIKFVYFPIASLVSFLSLVDRHLPLEVGLVGREGMVGAPLALGGLVSTVRALVQGTGEALQIEAERFLQVMQDTPLLEKSVLLYVNELLGQVTQTAACNRFHHIDARLARWLLMTRDRVGSAEFHMTHEFLAAMLGVRREGVTEAASLFKAQRLIDYSRGNIIIQNHEGLEAASCSCYAGGSHTLAPWRPTLSPAVRRSSSEP
jgi:CRP-like cAMP-binding protein